MCDYCSVLTFSMNQWENEKVLQLIKEYEKREILWKKDHKFYYNVVKKEDVIKKKIDSLRESRQREKARMMKSSVTGTGRDNLYVSKWFAWESMQFLNDPEGIRPTINNYSTSEHESEVDDPGSPAEGNKSNENITCMENANRQPKKLKSSKKVAPRKRNAEDPRVQEAYDILKSKVQGAKKDDSAMFGEYIAEKMRKLDNKQRSLLQHRIHSLVLEAEMATPTLESSQQQVEPPISSHLQSLLSFSMYYPSLSSSSHTLSPLPSPLAPSSHTSSPLPSPLAPSSHTSSPLPSPLDTSSHTSSPLPSPIASSSHTSSPLPSPIAPSSHTSSPLHSQIASSSANQLLTLANPESSPYDIRGYISSFSNADIM